MKNILKYTLAVFLSAVSFIGCKTEGKLSPGDLKALDGIQNLKTMTLEQMKPFETMIKGINFKALVEKKICASGDKKNDQACSTKFNEYFNNPQKREAINKKALEDFKLAFEDGIASKQIIDALKEVYQKSNDKMLTAKTMVSDAASAFIKCAVNDFKFTVVHKVEAPAPAAAAAPSADAKPEGKAADAPSEPVVVPAPAPAAPMSKSCFATALKPTGEVFFGDEKPPVMENKPVEVKPENK